MTEVAVVSDQNAPRSVSVGDASYTIPVDVYHAIHSQILGKTDDITQKYSDDLLIEFSEIEQLHYKITQLCDVHDVVSQVEAITIFYEKDRKQQFSSFSEFKKYNANSASPTVNVLLEYNFSIVPPQSRSFVQCKNVVPQEYKIKISLSSRVSKLRELKSDAPPFLRAGFFRLIVGTVAEITVQHADYVVARSFFEAFDDWIKSCKISQKNKFMTFLQTISHHFSDILKVLSLMFVFFSARDAVESLMVKNAGLGDYSNFFVLYAFAAYLFLLVGSRIGDKAESLVDGYVPLSYLNLNKGDDKVIGEYNANNRGMYSKLVGTVFIGIIVNFLSTFLQKLLEF